MTELKTIDQEVPKGKRLLFTDIEGGKREFHGPQRVAMEIPVKETPVLVDEIPVPPDTRTPYEKLEIERKFEGLRKHLKVTEAQVATAVSISTGL